VRIAIRVKPGSARPSVGGRHGGQSGQSDGGDRGDAVVVAVSERAVDGKATEAALRAVADAFGVRRRAVTLVIGASSRDKIVDIDGEADVLSARLAALLGPEGAAPQSGRTVTIMDSAATGTPVVTDNPAASRYEMHVGSELAGFVDYRLRHDHGAQVISLVHTEVEPAYQGAHLATHLARFSLDDARARGLSVLPFCPYINSWIKKHPEYTDLVPEERRGEFGL
jgi:hypothetical protein